MNDRQSIEAQLTKLVEPSAKSALQQLLDNPLPKNPEPPEDQTLNPFAFGYLAAAKDALGVPMARPAYVKRSCNQCYGRGFQLDGFHKRYIACRCVHNAYLRAVRLFNYRVRDTMAGYVGDKPEEATQAVQKRFLSELFGE